MRFVRLGLMLGLLVMLTLWTVPVTAQSPTIITLAEQVKVLADQTKILADQIQALAATPTAPVNCVVSPFTLQSATAWGTCTAGQQTRTETWARTITTPPANGGAACPVLTETRIGSQPCTITPSTGFPTAATTGVPSGTTLRSCGSAVTLATANQVIDGCIYTGDVLVTASNVTIRRSEIRGKVSRVNSGSFTIEDSLIGPASGCSTADGQLQYSNYTARRVRLRNVSDGFRVSGSNVLIEDSMVTMCSNPGDHSDGVQGYGGGTNVIVRHNTLDQRGAADVNAVIFFADNSQSAVVENNLLMGGGYTLRLHDDFNPDRGPWRAVGNRIVNGAWLFGPMNNSGTTFSAATCSDNRLVTIDSNYNVLTLGATVPCS